MSLPITTAPAGVEASPATAPALRTASSSATRAGSRSSVLSSTSDGTTSNVTPSAASNSRRRGDADARMSGEGGWDILRAYRSRTVTFSMCAVCGNMSTGCTSRMVNPPSTKIRRSRASVPGSHET